MYKIYLIFFIILIIILLCKNKNKNKKVEKFTVSDQAQELIYSCMNVEDTHNNNSKCWSRKVGDLINPNNNYEGINVDYDCKPDSEGYCNSGCKNEGEYSSSDSTCIKKDFDPEKSFWNRFKDWCESQPTNKQIIKKINDEYEPLKKEFEENKIKYDDEMKKLDELKEKYYISEYEYLDEKAKKKKNQIEKEKSCKSKTYTKADTGKKEYYPNCEEKFCIEKNFNSCNDYCKTLTYKSGSNYKNYDNCEHMCTTEGFDSCNDKREKLGDIFESVSENSDVNSGPSPSPAVETKKEIYERLKKEVDDQITIVNVLKDKLKEVKKEFFVSAYPSKCPEKGLLSINNNVALKNLSNLAEFASKEQIKTTLIKQLKR